MKEEIAVSLVQFASEWLAPEANIERMCSFVEAEAGNGAELVVLPELANIGFITPVSVGGPVDCNGLSYREFASRYIKAAEPVPGPTTEAVAALARKHGVHVVVGIARRHPVIPQTLYNSAVLIGPAGIIGVFDKMHIPQNEKQFFYPGEGAGVYQTEIGNIGMQICYDLRFPEITRILALKGAEIVCCPLASSIPPQGSALMSQEDMDSLKYRSHTRALENGIFFICCNRSGWQGQTRFKGHSVIAAPNGAILAASDSVEEEVIRARLRESQLSDYRATMSIFRDRRPEKYGLITAPFLSSDIG